MRSLSARILLFLFVFLLSLAAADLVLRWYLQVPSDYLSRIVRIDGAKTPSKGLMPNLNKELLGAYREFKFRLTTDERGFRRSALQEGVVNSRIVFLGDSQTVGVGVGDTETFPSILADRLRRPVLNTACYGYSTIEEAELLAGPISDLRPDTIVLCFFAGNDPYENFRHHQDRAGGSHAAGSHHGGFLSSVKSFLVRNSSLYHALLRLRKYKTFNELFYIMGAVNSEAPSELIVFKKDPDSAQESFWRITEDAIEGISRQAQARGARFLLLFIPDRYQVDAEYWKAWMQKYRLNAEHYDLLAPNKRISSFCQARGIPFLDATEGLKEEEHAGRRPYWSIDNHLNAQGNRRIAEELYDYFRERA